MPDSIEIEVGRQEIKDLIVLLKGVDQGEIPTTKIGAKIFYSGWLDLVERVINLHPEYDFDLGFVIIPLKEILARKIAVEVISTVLVFDNSESSRMLFIAELEDALEKIITNEYSTLLHLQNNPDYQGLKVGWV